MTEHMCQHNSTLYTTFGPLPPLRSKVTGGNFKPKPISALFTKSYTFHHFSSLSHRRPSVQAIGVIFEPKPISTPFNKNPTQFITFHHFWMASSLKPNPISAPAAPVAPRRVEHALHL